MFTPNKNLTAKYTKGKSINTVLAFGADNNFFVAKASATKKNGEEILHEILRKTPKPRT